ncbi:hypothetical protein LT23_02091 [Klebsiella pneumoniae]|nr:hypothetical protein LT23_02091 [Klebsiella pneumoniae]SWU90600.1 Uncharacterised protein [Klebsiella pneumoniae]
MKEWQGQPTTKKPAPAVFNITNGEKEMPNSSIMALALAMCNVEQGQAVKVPAMDGSNLHLAIFKTLHLCDFEPFFNNCNLYDQNNSLFNRHLQSTSFFC